MKDVYASARASGVDIHYKFSTVTMRDQEGRVVRRERLDHGDRAVLRAKVSGWPREQLGPGAGAPPFQGARHDDSVDLSHGSHDRLGDR